MGAGKHDCFPVNSPNYFIAEATSYPLLIIPFKVARAWRETTPVCSGLTRLVRAGYSRHYSGASRERARITQHAQDGSVHMQLVSRPATIPPRSTLRVRTIFLCTVFLLIYLDDYITQSTLIILSCCPQPFCSSLNQQLSHCLQCCLLSSSSSPLF